MRTENKTIEEMEKRIVKCKKCGVEIDELIIGIRGCIAHKRTMPNQPYQDVLQDYINCPRCEQEIILGESRLSLTQSMNLALADLQRSKGG